MTRLSIELIPKTSWGINARSLLSPGQWDSLRREAYKRAGYCCEICGGRGPDHPVECHEIWEFDDEKHIQKLVGLITLCPACHRVKHFGRATAIGVRDEATAHLRAINNWDERQAQDHINEAYEMWSARSGHNWIVQLDPVVEKDDNA
jgi:hypothetical protein